MTPDIEEVKAAVDWMENTSWANCYGDNRDGYKMIEHLKQAALAYIQSLENGGWLPIETAPKDGTKYLVYVEKPMHQNKEPEIMITCEKDGLYDGLMFFHDPTHWQPLPQPPKENE